MKTVNDISINSSRYLMKTTYLYKNSLILLSFVIEIVYK
jgi:hypothetical protein